MQIILLAAVQFNDWGLGDQNQLLYRLKHDLKRFRQRTVGHKVIMGRKTYESIGHPLPNRDCYVLTRQEDWLAEGVTVVHDIQTLMTLLWEEDPQADVFVIGGAEVYQAFLPYADQMLLTMVNGQRPADVYFPSIPSCWSLVESTPHQPDFDVNTGETFETWEQQWRLTTNT